MKQTSKVIAGDRDYQKGGYYIAPYQTGLGTTEQILTYRCDVCFQHMSLYDYAIDKSGNVTPDIKCPNCKTTHEGLTLGGYTEKLSKQAGQIYIR